MRYLDNLISPSSHGIVAVTATSKKGRRCGFTDGQSPEFFHQNALQKMFAPLRVLASSLTKSAVAIMGFTSSLSIFHAAIIFTRKPPRFCDTSITLAVPVQPLPLCIMPFLWSGTRGQKERLAHRCAWQHPLSPLKRQKPV